MFSNKLKTGLEVHINIGNVALKGLIESQENNIIKIVIPSHWRNVIKDLKIDSACTLTCKSEKGNYLRYKMILVNKLFTAILPEIQLKPVNEAKEQADLREHKRIEIFVFTEASNTGIKIGEKAPHTATITNISMGGCLTMSNYDYNTEDCIWLVFGLADETCVPLTVKCRIKNKRQAPIEKSFYYGLEFVEIGSAEKEKIRAFIDSENHK